jgi:HSP20 family molecular chaperone IbpA
MQTIIPSTSLRRPRNSVEAPVSTGLFRKPHYDCLDLGDTVKLTVFVPGVKAAGVEIASRGPDLTVTARKAHFVRVNFTALHLENSQRDYQLRLRLGHGLDYATLQAEIADGGVLTITLPKKQFSADAVNPSGRALGAA